MNLKKIFVSSLFVIPKVGTIAPVNEALDFEFGTMSIKPINGKTKLNFTMKADIGLNKSDLFSNMHNTPGKLELNSVNKVVVSIKGYNPITFKRPVKGWKMKHKNTIYQKFLSVKGNPNGKNYSIEFYSKKGKIIRSEKGKVPYSWFIE